MRKDTATAELPGVPARRGRPATGKAKDGAARQRAYRERLAAEGKEDLSLILSKDLADALRAYVGRRAADGEPLTMGDAAEKILRDRLMRKR